MPFRLRIHTCYSNARINTPDERTHLRPIYYIIQNIIVHMRPTRRHPWIRRAKETHFYQINYDYEFHKLI